MRAGAIFLAFFFLFTCASIAVPVPMFPGNMLQTWLDVPYINALVNGLTYGLITWIVFLFINGRIEKSLSTNP
jgi:hypothetical protein